MCNLSPHIQSSYVLQVSIFARHFGRSPEELGPEEIRAWQPRILFSRPVQPPAVSNAPSLRPIPKPDRSTDSTIGHRDAGQPRFRHSAAKACDPTTRKFTATPGTFKL